MRKLFYLVVAGIVSVTCCFVSNTKASAHEVGLSTLLQAAQKGDPVERQRAILRLIEHNDPRVIKILIQAFEDSDRHVRYAAVWAMGHLKIQRPLPFAAVAVLLKNIQSRDERIKIEAVSSLVEIESHKAKTATPLNGEVLEAFLKLANDPNPFVRADAIKGLRLWETDPRAADMLRTAFYDEVWLVRLNGKWPSNENDGIGIETITRALGDEAPFIRIKAILALRQYHGPKLVDLLIQGLGDSHNQVVYESILQLASLRDPKGVGPLLDLYLTQDRWKDLVASAIQQITGGSIDEALEGYKQKQKKRQDNISVNRVKDIELLINKLSKGTLHERVTAALRMAWIEDLRVVKALVQALQDKDSFVQSVAVGSLGTPLLKSRLTIEILDLLIQAANTSDPFVRRSAIGSIGNFIHSDYKDRATDFLLNIAKEEKDPFARNLAVHSLSTVRSRESGEALQEFLTDEFFMVRERAVAGINLSCFPKSTGLILRALSDPVPDVRLAAVRNLSMVGADTEKDEYQKVIQRLTDIAHNDSNEEIRNVALQAIKSIEIGSQLSDE